MEIEHVAGIRLATRGAFEDEGHLAVSDGLLGEVIVNDERIHAVVHEPLTHCCAGERREILRGSGSVGTGSDDDGVFESASLVEFRDDAGYVGLLLADRDVDAVNRAEVRVTGSAAHLVDARLVNHRVHADGGLARRAVTDDEFALATTDGNHRVNCHDAGLERLADGFALHDAGRNFLDWILSGRSDGPLAVHGAAKGINDAAQQAFAHGDGEELAGGLHLGALADVEIVAEHDDTDLGLFEVQRDADDAAAKVEHLVEHRVGEALNLGHTVGDFTDDADVLPGHGGLEARDLGFDVLQDGAHSNSLSRKIKGCCSTPRGVRPRCRRKCHCRPEPLRHRATPG